MPPDGTDDDAMWALLARYVAGECTLAESKAVRNWSVQDASHALLLAELTQAWDRSRSAPVSVNVEQGWRRIASDVATARRSRVRAWMPVTLAASVLLATAAALTIATQSSTVYASGIGSNRVITLPDGTTATLAPESRLSVPRRYGHSTRDVRLDGEAYFAVVHDARMPFVVSTGDVRTTDVGTAFDVRAYGTDSATRVVVAEGRVAVHAATDAVVSAGQMTAVTGPERTVAAVTRADVGAAVSWMTGRLVVRDVPLHALIPDLQRWYGLDVIVTDTTLRERLITATWSTEPPEQVLRELGGLLHARVMRDGHHVRLERLQ
jgi:transmembrane sensor